MKLVSSSFFFLYGIGLNLPVFLNAAPNGNRNVGSNSNFASYTGAKNGAQISAGHQSQASRNPQNASGNKNKIGNQKKQKNQVPSVQTRVVLGAGQGTNQQQQQQPQTQNLSQNQGQNSSTRQAQTFSSHMKNVNGVITSTGHQSQVSTGNGNQHGGNIANPQNNGNVGPGNKTSATPALITQAPTTQAPKYDVDKCIEKSKRKIVSDYLEIAAGFKKLMKSISQPIFQSMDGDEWMRKFMIKNMFKPCSDYISQLKNFDSHYEMVDSYVFRKFVDELNPNSFNPAAITKQVIDVSGWEMELEKFSEITETEPDFGADSKEQLKQIVEQLYDMFTEKYKKWYAAGMPDTQRAMKQSVIIQLNECDDQYQNCLTLAGVLQINYNPRKRKAAMRLIGGVTRIEYMESESTPVYDFSSEMSEEQVQQLEFLFSYHRNLKKMRKKLHDEFSAVFDNRAGLKNFDNTDSDKNCKGLVIPESMKTYSDCAPPTPIRHFSEKRAGKNKNQKQKFKPKSWFSRRKREADSDDEQLENEDSVRCILMGTCNNDTHSVQKRYINRNAEKFRKEFFKDVHRKVSGYGGLMDSRDFERSACMLDKVDSDTNKQIGIKIHTDIQFSKMEQSFAKFLVTMFGQNCDDCLTRIVRRYYDDFTIHINQFKENIKTRFAEKEKMENNRPYGANYELGEFGYIQYYIFYEIVDWKDENDPSAHVVDPMKCVIFPSSPGCTNTASSNNVPQKINIAYYAFYSEIKLRQTAMNEKNISPLKHRFKQEVMEKYFEYQFIKDMIYSMPVDFKQQYPRIEIKGEKNILNVVNDIEYPTTYGICREVIDLFEECYTKNNEKRHFIFLLDGSGSVSWSDFNNMKRSIESMVYYPMNGQNKVSIVEFGSSQQKLCDFAIAPHEIEECLKPSKKDGGGTDINGAMDYAVRNFINVDKSMNHVVVIFTDGMPNSSVEHKVAELRRLSRVSVTGFGIGSAFNSASAIQQLKYITNERYNLDETKYRIRNFSEFEKNRLDLQKTICSA